MKAKSGELFEADAETKSEGIEKIFTVAEYIELLNVFFKEHGARIQGEISEFKIAASGHVYFSMKDQSGSGVLDCVMWKGVYALCGVEFQVGMEVIVSGHPKIYPPTGRLSIVCDSVELVGEGALKKAYDVLRKKLEEDGVFAPERKRPIPEFVHKIGVITSMKGAVIHDFENNLGKFGFSILCIDSRVEGQAALKDLRAAIRTMRKQDIEVLVVIRGGGSLESLQAFNNEALVREVVDFPVPVIAGIGHDKDVPLMALAADAMTSTPTAAAHLLNVSWEEAYAKIHQVAYLLTRITQEFKRIRADLDTAWSSFVDHTTVGLGRMRERLLFAEQSLKLNDPTRQLKLGYSIVRQNGRILRSMQGLKTGDELNTQFSDGEVQSKIT